MESRILEIDLQYAKDLNNVNLITKMDVYVVASISGGSVNSKQKTKSTVDHDGGSNPTWNFPMKFTVDEAALQQNRLTLDFKLVCERALGDKGIGEVNVPIKELFDSPAKGEGKQSLSYQVRKPSGKPKGQLSFAYKFGEKTAAADPLPVTAYPAGSSAPYPTPKPGVYPPPVAYPAAASSEAGGNYPPPAGYPQPGYGSPPQPVQQPPKKKKFGLGLGAGLLGGALVGLLIGDMIPDGGGCGGGCGGGGCGGGCGG